MSANTDVYCLVVKEVFDVVVVQAATLEEAKKEAKLLDGVVRVLKTSYEPQEPPT